MESTDRSSRVYLFGGHTEHSLAPTLWNFVFDRLRLHCTYIPLNADADSLRGEMDRLRRPGTIGANITIPLKEAGASLADQCHEDVRLTGATNWLTWRDGSLYAANTDAGAARKLTEGISGQVLLLGAGGGAAAVAAGMRGYVDRMIVTDVDGRRAQKLSSRIESWGVEATVVPWSERRWQVASSDVLVNATPLGMAGPLAQESPVDPAWLSGHLHVYDLVYAPSQTPLQCQATARGLPLIDGLAHLYEQAVALLPLMDLGDETAILLEEGLSAAFDGRRRIDWNRPSSTGRAVDGA